MSRRQEFYAPSVEEAVNKAAAAAGISPEDMSYEVMDQGSSGFLGIGARDARIVIDAPQQAQAAATQEPSPADEHDETFEIKDVQKSTARSENEETTEGKEISADVIEDITGFLEDSLQKMGIEARLEVYDAGEFIAADISAPETGLLIGSKGETINALQYLANSAAYKDKNISKRIVLDVEGYRQRRIEAIQGMAQRAAKRAAREGKPVKLPAMNSSERRTVHVFLKDNPKLRTQSEGSRDNRRVTIIPV